jgi:hypothetical protein
MRLKIYPNDNNCWYIRTGVGKANNFQVIKIQLPGDTTTTMDELLREMYAPLKDFDGIQLMCPLPPQMALGESVWCHQCCSQC